MTREKTKDILGKVMIYGFLITCIFVFADNIFADQITHKFKSPSFFPVPLFTTPSSKEVIW